MNNERLQQLLEFYKAEPNDPFNIYCLANEYKESDPETAIKYYQILLESHADYLPSYYQAAYIYINARKIDLAENILNDGIKLASKQGDQPALRELKNLQNNLLDY